MKGSVVVGAIWAPALVCGMLFSGATFAADAVAGKAAATACSQCHEPKDWEGETESSLESLIRDVVRGAVKHTQKVTLSDPDIANVAAYWASSSK